MMNNIRHHVNSKLMKQNTLNFRMGSSQEIYEKTQYVK